MPPCQLPSTKYKIPLRRHTVTLCIAAACLDGDEPKVVLCTDWREEVEGVGSAETSDKLTFIKDGWLALLAGDGAAGDALVSVYQTELGDTTLTQANLLTELEKPMHKRKQCLADSYTRQTLGMAYSEFLRYGKQKFPEDFFKEHISQIMKIRLDASLIICGFVDEYDHVDKKTEKWPWLVRVQDDPWNPQNNLTIEADFTAIGSGADSALASLYRREQQSELSLMHTIYFLYEAKRLSEGVPGVGESISIDVLDQDGNVASLTDEGYDKCDELFRRFGPRMIDNENDTHRLKFKMKAEYTDSFHAQWNKESEKRKQLRADTPMPEPQKKTKRKKTP
jgi:hypothetical protein